jgi:hypothetical protein
MMACLMMMIMIIMKVEKTGVRRTCIITIQAASPCIIMLAIAIIAIVLTTHLLISHH